MTLSAISDKLHETFNNFAKLHDREAGVQFVKKFKCRVQLKAYCTRNHSILF